MVDHVQHGIWVLFGLFIAICGWLVVIANGRRPLSIRVKGLGVAVDVNPCDATCTRASDVHGSDTSPTAQSTSEPTNSGATS